MRFAQATIAGVWVLHAEPHQDERGSFSRVFCEDEFREHGLHTQFPQCNISHNVARATLRGMHYQADPAAEVKVVRCIRGEAFDVVVDLRRGSPTYRRWEGFTITARNRCAIYIPTGCAHGFQTLADDTELFYHMGMRYSPEHARGVRWNDPAFGIEWPLPDPVLSAKDRQYADFQP